MFIKQSDIVRLRNVCLISIVLTKSFNLIPTSKKSTEFFQSVRIFPAVFVQIFEKVIWEHCCQRVLVLVPVVLQRSRLWHCVDGFIPETFGADQVFANFWLYFVCFLFQWQSHYFPDTLCMCFQKKILIPDDLIHISGLQQLCPPDIKHPL